MGSKPAAKASAQQYNMLLRFGSDKAIDDINDARALAAHIGYPVLIKASAGGGAKACALPKKKPTWKNSFNAL